MGKGDQETKQQTSVTTTTSTSVRDIGLTGRDAVAMAGIINRGGVQREQISAARFDSLLQHAGKAYEQLIGGASTLVASAGAQAGEYIAAGENLQQLRAGEESSDLAKVMPYLAIAVAGLAPLLLGKRS